MAYAFLAAAALLPMLFITRVSHESLRRVRHQFLYGIVGLGILAVGSREPWLAVIGAYLWWWWRQPTVRDPLRREPWEKAPMLAWWAAIAGVWFLALEMPGWVWGWLPTAWGIAAWGTSAAMAYQVIWLDPAKVRGWWGMRSIAGAFLALVTPLLPLWAWPGPLIGLWLSGPSWVALAALSAASIWRWPIPMIWGPIVATSLLAALLVFVWRPVVAGRAIGEFLPRGDTLDTLWARTALLRLAWQDWRWQGVGPGTTAFCHMRAWARGRFDGADFGTLHNEPAQLALEYGVVGVVAGLLFMYRVGTHLALGDPWSACVVAGAVLALGTMSLRIASIGGVFLFCCAEVLR